MPDSEAYKARKQFLRSVLTVYGRKPCLEALEDNSLQLHRLHLADSNRPAPVIERIIALANKREVEIRYHSKKALSRISKNSQQDQGVALDCMLNGFADIQALDLSAGQPIKLIALDNVTNPQNLGMIIRSVCASPATGLLLPERGCARLDALVIKASAGTLFKAKVFRCDNLVDTLTDLSRRGFHSVCLDLEAEQSFSSFNEPDKVIYVLGNESDGVTHTVRAVCDQHIRIPMNNGVESLNVAVTAALIAFKSLL